MIEEILICQIVESLLFILNLNLEKKTIKSEQTFKKGFY